MSFSGKAPHIQEPPLRAIISIAAPLFIDTYLLVSGKQQQQQTTATATTATRLGQGWVKQGSFSYVRSALLTSPPHSHILAALLPLCASPPRSRAAAAPRRAALGATAAPHAQSGSTCSRRANGRASSSHHAARKEIRILARAEAREPRAQAKTPAQVQRRLGGRHPTHHEPASRTDDL